jgi:hypothetical protein
MVNFTERFTSAKLIMDKLEMAGMNQWTVFNSLRLFPLRRKNKVTQQTNIYIGSPWIKKNEPLEWFLFERTDMKWMKWAFSSIRFLLTIDILPPFDRWSIILSSFSLPSVSTDVFFQLNLLNSTDVIPSSLEVGWSAYALQDYDWLISLAWSCLDRYYSLPPWWLHATELTERAHLTE